MNFSISARKNAFVFIITVGVLNTLIAISMYFYLKDSLLESIYKRNVEIAKLEFEKTKEHIKSELDHYKLILKVMKEDEHFKKYIDSLNEKNRDIFVHDLESIAKSNRDIFQIRYLDSSGKEKIRVDKINGDIFEADVLQNKSNRYYFKKTKELKDGEFYISDLDLNIENKKIERPFKPTIRVATPIYRHGAFLGILIINYKVSDLVEYISKRHIFDVYYVDDKGNFLLHPDQKKSWSSQLRTNYKAVDEIKNFEDLKKDNYKDKNWIYYINRITFTDKAFFILYSIKNDIYAKEIKDLKEEIFTIFIIIFLVTLPVVLIGAYIQAFQMRILETLIDTLPFPVALKNKKGQFVLINNSLAKLYGFEKKEQLLGKVSYEFNSKNLPYTRREKDLEVIKSDRIKFEEIVYLPEENKRLYLDTRLIKITFFGIVNKDFILGIAIDITNLKELNLKLEKRVEDELIKRVDTENQLSQKAKLAEIGNLIDNIILQWEAPLNLISLNAQSMELEYEATNNLDIKNTLTRVETIKENTQIMFDTVDDFKLFLSFNNGVELFTIGEVVIRVDRILKGRLNKNHIEIEKNIDPELTIKGLKNEFSQVVLNLINNALNEFENPNNNYDNMSISIAAFETEDSIILSVKDNAKPIEVDEELFTNENVKGLRTGLDICQNIINNIFKGTIEIKSQDDMTIFEIKIPK